MNKYIDADKLIAEIERQQRKLTVLSSHSRQLDMKRDCALQNGVYLYILGIITSLKQEQKTKVSIVTPSGQAENNLTFEEYLRGIFEINNGIENDPDNLVRIHAPELLKLARKQEQSEVPSGEDVMVMCNQILIDWVKEGNTQEEKEQREQAHIRFFELYDHYLMQKQPEVDLVEEIKVWLSEGDITDTKFDDYDNSDIEKTARHFYELGRNARKEE